MPEVCGKVTFPGYGHGFLAALMEKKSDTCSTDSSEHNSDHVSNQSFDGSYKRHFKSTGPPGTDGDERFAGSYSEMRKQ
jgi:hypothetical protein